MAKSTSLAATATADPLDDPPGMPIRARRIDRRAVMRVDALEAEGEFVGDGLAGQLAPAASSASTAGADRAAGDLRLQPIRIAATGRRARDVDQILDGECHAIERSRGRWARARSAVPG